MINLWSVVCIDRLGHVVVDNEADADILHVYVSAGSVGGHKDVILLLDVCLNLFLRLEFSWSLVTSTAYSVLHVMFHVGHRHVIQNLLA